MTRWPTAAGIILLFLITAVAAIPDRNTGEDQSTDEDAAREERFLLKKYVPFDIHLQNGVNHALKHQNVKGKCTAAGGVFINNECYKLIDTRATYANAVANCEDLGGHLWTPNLNDTHFYKKLRMLMPYEFWFNSFNKVWIGFNLQTLQDIQGQDISNMFLAQLGRASATTALTGCAALNFQFGSLYLEDIDCDATREYICTISAY